MRRRKLIGVLAAGLLVLLAAGAFVAWPRSDRISATNFHRLRVGMSKAEVETILGPAGDHRTGDTTLSSASYRPETMGDFLWVLPEAVACEEWVGEEWAIMVDFDTAGNVSGAACFQVIRVDQGRLSDLVWRARRQSRHWFP
jgi:hypothetical protein